MTQEEQDALNKALKSYGWWQMSYGGFNRLRHLIAETVNLSLGTMTGYGGDTEWPKSNDSSTLNRLVPFLNHSDCDGELSPEQCKLIWPALDHAIANWHALGDGIDEYYKDKLIALRILIYDAAENEHWVWFS